MNRNHPQFVKDFNSVIEDAEVFRGIARCSELQRNAVDSLIALLAEVGDLKNKAVARGDEDTANLLLGYESATTSLISEIKMWILLKQERPDEAWDELVSAQMSSLDAARSHKGFEHAVHHYQRLVVVEQVVFPPQVFVSAGMIVRSQECSICGNEYEDCEHVIGRPYMGAMCHIIARELDVDHVAIVKNPSDKRCRIREFEVEGGVRNKMTWRVERRDSEGRVDESGGIRAQATILHTTGEN